MGSIWVFWSRIGDHIGAKTSPGRLYIMNFGSACLSNLWCPLKLSFFTVKVDSQSQVLQAQHTTLLYLPRSLFQYCCRLDHSLSQFFLPLEVMVAQVSFKFKIFVFRDHRTVFAPVRRVRRLQKNELFAELFFEKPGRELDRFTGKLIQSSRVFQ